MDSWLPFAASSASSKAWSHAAAKRLRSTRKARWINRKQHEVIVSLVSFKTHALCSKNATTNTTQQQQQHHERTRYVIEKGQTYMRGTTVFFLNGNTSTVTRRIKRNDFIDIFKFCFLFFCFPLLPWKCSKKTRHRNIRQPHTKSLAARQQRNHLSKSFSRLRWQER